LVLTPDCCSSQLLLNEKPVFKRVPCSNGNNHKRERDQVVRMGSNWLYHVCPLHSYLTKD